MTRRFTPGSTGNAAMPPALISDQTAAGPWSRRRRLSADSMPSAMPSSSRTASCGVSFTAVGDRAEAQALFAAHDVIAVRPAQRGPVNCLRLIGRDVADERQHRRHPLPLEPVVDVVADRGIGGAGRQINPAALEIAVNARVPRVLGLTPSPQCGAVRLRGREWPR